MEDILSLYRIHGPTLTNTLLLTNTVYIDDENTGPIEDRLLSPIFYPRVSEWVKDEEEGEVTLVNGYPINIYRSLDGSKPIASYHSGFMGSDYRERYHEPYDIYTVSMIKTGKMKQIIKNRSEESRSKEILGKVDKLMNMVINKTNMDKIFGRDMPRHGRLLREEWREIQSKRVHDNRLTIHNHAKMMYFPQNLPRVRLVFQVDNKGDAFKRLRGEKNEEYIVVRTILNKVAEESFPSIDAITNEKVMQELYKLRYEPSKLPHIVLLDLPKGGGGGGDDTHNLYYPMIFTLLLSHNNQTLHEMVLTRILYTLYGEKQELKDLYRSAGFHFRFIYGRVLFNDSSRISPSLQYFIKEETRPMMKEMEFETFIMIIFQVLYTLELAWDLAGFKHNELTIRALSVVYPNVNKSFVYHRGVDETYILNGGGGGGGDVNNQIDSTLPLIKIHVSPFSTIKIGKVSRDSYFDDDEEGSDIKSFIHSLIDQYGATFMTTNGAFATSSRLFRMFLLLCHNIGVKHKYINNIYNKEGYSEIRLNERPWRENQITPWKCLNETSLFDHLKMITNVPWDEEKFNQKTSLLTRQHRKVHNDIRRNKLYIRGHDENYVVLGGGGERSSIVIQPIIPRFLEPLNPNYTPWDVLKLTNAKLAKEMNDFIATFSMERIPTEYKKVYHIKESSVANDKGDRLAKVYGDDNNDILFSYWVDVGGDKEQGRSKSFINNFDIPKGWVLKRMVINKGLPNEDSEALAFKKSGEYSDELYKALLEKDHVYSPNFMKIANRLFYALKEDDTFVVYLCQVSERLDNTLEKHFIELKDEDSLKVNQSLQSVLFQTLHAVEAAYSRCRFIHYDLNYRNVMLKVIPEDSSSILSRKNGNYTWLYQRVIENEPILYKPPQLETYGEREKVNGEVPRNRIVKILDYGDSMIRPNKSTDVISYLRKKDLNLFFVQLLLFVIPHNVELDPSFIQLCEEVIAFKIQSQKNLVELLLDTTTTTTIVTLHVPSKRLAKEWNYIGIELIDESRITLTNKTAFEIFINTYPIDTKTTITSLREYQHTKIGWVLWYELIGLSLAYYPDYTYKNNGLNATEALNTSYFDSIQCDLSYMYTKPCILLSYMEDKPVSSPPSSRKPPPSPPINVPLSPKPPKNASPSSHSIPPPPPPQKSTEHIGGGGGGGGSKTTTTTDITDGIYDHVLNRIYNDLKEIEKAFQPYCEYLIYNKRFIHTSEDESNCGSLSDSKNDMTRKETMIRMTNSTITTTTLLNRYKNFAFGEGRGDDTIVVSIKPQKWLLFKIEHTIATTNRLFDENITFVYPYQLKYVINPSMLPSIYTSSSSSLIGHLSYLLYERTSDQVHASWGELFKHNQDLVEKLVYTKFNAHITEHYNYMSLQIINKKNDCYKIAVLQTLRHVIYWLDLCIPENKAYYVPKVLQNIYDQQFNAYMRRNQESVTIDFSEFDKFIISTTSNNAIKEDVKNGDQCDATDIFNQLWRLIFDVNHCNEEAGKEYHIPFKPDDLSVAIKKEPIIHTRDIFYDYGPFKIPNDDVFFISYPNIDYNKGILGKGVSNTLFFDPVIPHPTEKFVEYILIALIVHKSVGNSGGSGHYVAYVRSKKDADLWILYDDQFATTILGFRDVPTSETEPMDEKTPFEHYMLTASYVKTPYLGVYMNSLLLD